MRLAVATTLLLFVGFAVTAKADDFVTNGTFSPGNGVPGYGPVSGWTEVGAGTGSTNFDTAGLWNNGTLPSGTTVGFIQGAGSFSQSLSGLTVGQTYQLSFVDNARMDLGCGSPCGATPTLTVSLDGTTLLGPTAVNSVGDSNLFNFVEGTFVASAAMETLEFFSTTPLNPNGGPTDGTLLLSDVTVSATPEPSSLMLLGTGILGAAGMMRRRFLHS